MKLPHPPKTANSELEKLLLNGTLWPGQAPPSPPNLRPTSDYTNNLTSNTSPSTYFSDRPHARESLSPTSLASTIQEIFLETGIEDQSRNLWLPAYGFVCESLKNLPTNKEHSIAWICNNLYPNLEFLCSSDLDEIIHLVFTPSKGDLFSFIRKTIQADCFSVIVACAENLSFSQTRSLKLISKNTNSINLILRPPWEKDQHSASFVKYLVKPTRHKGTNTLTDKIGWSNEIIKLKAYEKLNREKTHSQPDTINLATK